MTIEKIIQYLAKLITSKFTGRIIIDVHEGNVSKKIKREVTDSLE
jgi:hypothetical protein